MGKLDGERLWCLASLFQENFQRPEFLMFMVVLSIVERSTFIMFREPFTVIFSSNSNDRTFSNCQEACCCSAASKFKPWFMDDWRWRIIGKMRYYKSRGLPKKLLVTWKVLFPWDQRGEYFHISWSGFLEVVGVFLILSITMDQISFLILVLVLFYDLFEF